MRSPTDSPSFHRSQAIFDVAGNEYNQTALLTDGKFDEAKYDAIGPARFSATNALFLVVDVSDAGKFWDNDS
jgi:hypothetical protein